MDWMWDFHIEIWQMQLPYKVSSPSSKAELKPLFAADLSSISNKITGGRGACTWRWSFQRYYLASKSTVYTKSFLLRLPTKTAGHWNEHRWDVCSCSSVFVTISGHDHHFTGNCLCDAFIPFYTKSKTSHFWPPFHHSIKHILQSYYDIICVACNIYYMSYVYYNLNW